MDKSVNRELNGLKFGISGFYRTRGFKIRLLALTALLLLIVFSICAIVTLNESVWSGRIYVFAYSNSFYSNNFYKMSSVEKLLDERDLSRSEFEDVARVTVIERKRLTQDRLVALGLDGIVPDAETLSGTKPYPITRFYCVLLDKDGNCLYQGINIADFIEALRASGF